MKKEHFQSWGSGFLVSINQKAVITDYSQVLKMSTKWALKSVIYFLHHYLNMNGVVITNSKICHWEKNTAVKGIN